MKHPRQQQSAARAHETATRDLDQAWAAMRFAVEQGTFVLVGFGGAPHAGDLEALAEPAQLVLEGGETTLLVREQALAGVLERHPEAEVERDLAWVRFEAPMGWELVGFLARVTTLLAAAGVPLGAVCGYHRDHLFIARAHLARARDVLRREFPEV